MRVAYAFRPFPANYKPSCDASKSTRWWTDSFPSILAFLAIPAKPTWNYPLKTSPSIPLATLQQPRSTTIFVNTVPYTVIRLLGEGLHSRVYAAYNRRTAQPVAIKVVQNVDPVRRNEHSKMFFKEIRYLTKLQTRNPYVIRVYDHEFDLKAKTGKIVMETGKDFRFMLPLQATPKEKKMSVDQAKFYWYQMLEAVASLHRHGFVHSGQRVTTKSDRVLKVHRFL